MLNEKDTNELVDFIKNIPSKIEIIDNIIDEKLFYRDYIDSAEELIKPLKAIGKVYEFAKKQRFKEFLKSISKEINENDFIDNNNVNKLKEYVSKDNNVDFIVNTIDYSINSRSIKCSSLLGFYAGNILNKYKDIDYKDFQIIEILKNIDDIELNIFKEFVDKTLNFDKEYYVPFEILNTHKEEEIVLMFNKFETYQMISRPNHLTIRDINGEPSMIKVSYIGKNLIELLNKTKI